METSEAFLGFDCAATGDRYDATATGRSDADVPLDAAYDYDVVDAAWPDHGSMWRFDDLLPVPATAAVSAHEGGTPLVDAPALADELGVRRVVLKDEGRNPTGSVLDRGLSVAVTAAARGDAEVVALASPGNGGQAAAAYATRAGLDSYAFVPSRTCFSNKAMINVHGGDMRVVGGRYDDAHEAMTEQWNDAWHSVQEFTSPYRHEGHKTLAYELLADLGWEVPDAVVVPTGSGEVLYGVAKGLRELATLGRIASVPRLVAAQPAGCAPVATAWEAGADDVEPWATPDTICGELEIPAPAGGSFALDALAATDGEAVTVEDADLLESAVVATQRVGVEVGIAGGAAVAAAWARADAFDEDATVAVVNTEAGGKTPDLLRSHLMGQGV